MLPGFVRIPSIMVQKTALGQSSPYIRGLTSYHNVLLVDGVRLNHSAMSSPNQYWSTAELYGLDRLETLRGTHGVIFGADSWGGIVNLLSAKPYYSDQKNIQRVEILGRFHHRKFLEHRNFREFSSPKWFAEISHMERSFGDLHPEEGKWGDKKILATTLVVQRFRFSRKVSDQVNLILGLQQNFMDDVPRTHKTVDGLNWEGLSHGREIWRRLDQYRSLYYGRIYGRY